MAKSSKPMTQREAMRVPPCPAWLVPLLAEPVEESWRAIHRRGRPTSSVCEFSGEDDGWRPSMMEDQLVISIRKRRVA